MFIATTVVRVGRLAVVMVVAMVVVIVVVVVAPSGGSGHNGTANKKKVNMPSRRSVFIAAIVGQGQMGFEHPHMKEMTAKSGSAGGP